MFFSTEIIFVKIKKNIAIICRSVKMLYSWPHVCQGCCTVHD